MFRSTVAIVWCCLMMASCMAINPNRDIAFPDELGVEEDRFHHPHHTYHSPMYHHHHVHIIHPAAGSGSDVAATDAQNRSSHKPSPKQIPLDYIQNLINFNVTDLLLNFVEDDEENAHFIQDRFNAGEERNAAVMAKTANCMPEVQTVKIASSDDPTVLYIPQCTRIERCGGCCSHPLLACRPEQTETVSYKVVKTQYTGGKKLKFVSKEIVQVEKHTKCKCDCKIQPGDCSQIQEYRKSECRCVCTNSDEEKKCTKNNNTKLWNGDVCACQCRDVLQCSTGSIFDYNECKCVVKTLRRRHAKVINDDLHVIPLNG